MKTISLLIALASAFAPAMAAAEDAWQWRLVPYAWLAGLKGNLATIPGLPEVSVDVSASEALRDLEGGGMLMLGAKRGVHGFVTDLLYTNVQSDFALLPPPIALNMKSVSKTTIASAAYQYELLRQGETVVDVMAGLRYWRVESELQFSGGLGILAGRRVGSSQSWVDPGIGIKARLPAGQSRFFFEGGAAVGGFHVGSERFYDVNANLGYRWSPSIETAIGYRVFDVDYRDNGFVFDVRQQGWQLGLGWSF